MMANAAADVESFEEMMRRSFRSAHETRINALLSDFINLRDIYIGFHNRREIEVLI